MARTLNYFTEKDFKNATPSCEMHHMKDHFLHRLDVARFHAEVPFIVLSAFRTIEHELDKGRNGSSSHCEGIAIDLKATNSRTLFKIIDGLRIAEFTRIGIYGWGVHADLDEYKDQEVMWR